MRISLNWINDFVDLSGVDPVTLGRDFTMTMAEVEKVEHVGAGLENIVVAEILEVRPHPAADRLVICKINAGGAPFEVVCGAPNAKPGVVSPYIPPGAVLADGTKVKEAKVRGVLSPGMLGAADELGIGEDHTGIIELDKNLKPGTPFSEIIPLSSYVFEIDNRSLTHRGDLWSHYGVAREIAAILGRPLKPLSHDALISSNADPIKVSIENFILCPRYAAIVIEGLEIRPSPLWMQKRLALAGVRPLNNIVDITNYVMLEAGQPLHAFDADKLAGAAIVVRTARPGEKIRTLDGVERSLSAGMLAICDAEKPIAIAGIMGGQSSEITASTRRMVLESANFNAASIRKTSNALRLRSEAVSRFEKSLDPELPIAGLKRFLILLKELEPSARAASKLYDVAKFDRAPRVIELELAKLNTLLGANVPKEKTINILKRLAFKVSEKSAGVLRVEVPSFRAARDVSISEDLVEEVGRYFGYGNIEPALPLQRCAPPWRDAQLDFEEKVRDVLSGPCGMHEVSTHSFVSDAMLEKIGAKMPDAIGLRNPLNQDETLLRTSMVFNLLGAAQTNHRLRSAFDIYEIGRTYHLNEPGAELPLERRTLGILLFRKKTGAAIFYDAKGAVDSFLAAVGFKKWEFIPILKLSTAMRDGWTKSAESANEALEKERPWVHPARALGIVAGGSPVGAVYEIHPRILKSLDIEGEAAAIEIDLSALLEKKPGVQKTAPIPRFPAVALDLTVALGDAVPWGEIEDAIWKSKPHDLGEISFKYVYKGEEIPAGKKSVTLTLTFRSDKKTLSQLEAEDSFKKIVKTLSEKFGAEQR
jgi:phenylalanyl-tRNA synthetase beta chain